MPRKAKKTESSIPPHLTDKGFMRLPAVLAVYPVSERGWWRGVAEGRYPRPVKLSPAVTAWRVSDIRELLETRDHDPTEDDLAPSA